MSLIRVMFFLVAMVLAAVSVQAQAPTASSDKDDVLAVMQRQYESLTSFQAAFVQTLTNAASKESEKRQGTIGFRQPGLVRWETVKPEPELLVVGRDAVWDYFPDEETAYKYPVQEVLGSKTMVRFISGKARLDEDFYITQADEPDNGLVRLELTPKEPEPNLVSATAWVDKGMSLLTRVKLVDFFGNINDLALEGLVLNPDLPDSMFRFTPPKGVDVLDNTK